MPLKSDLNNAMMAVSSIANTQPKSTKICDPNRVLNDRCLQQTYDLQGDPNNPFNGGTVTFDYMDEGASYKQDTMTGSFGETIYKYGPTDNAIRRYSEKKPVEPDRVIFKGKNGEIIELSGLQQSGGTEISWQSGGGYTTVRHGPQVSYTEKQGEQPESFSISTLSGNPGRSNAPFKSNSRASEVQKQVVIATVDLREYTMNPAEFFNATEKFRADAYPGKYEPTYLDTIPQKPVKP